MRGCADTALISFGAFDNLRICELQSLPKVAYVHFINFEYQVASANPSHANICLIYYMQTNVREWLAWHNKKR